MPAWWFYPAGQLNSNTSALSFPLLKGKGGENTMEGLKG